MNIPIENKIMDIHPCPIIILDQHYQIIRSNSASAVILHFWKVKTGEKIPQDCLEDLARKKEIKINTGKQIYALIKQQEQDNILLFAQDITKSYWTTKKLTQSEERYKIIANNVHDIIYRLDTEGNILYISPSCKNLLKIEPSEMLGQHFTTLILEDDVADVNFFFKQGAYSQRGFHFNLQDKDRG